MRRILLLLISSLAPACESTDTVHAGQLILTPGAETSPWDVSPRATSARLYTVSADGTREDGAEANVPLETLNVNSNTVSAYGFDGFDIDGHRVLGGRSLFLDAEALADSSLPVFYSRARTFARPPGEFPLPPGGAPVHSTLQGRYWVTLVPNDDGTMTLMGYDLLAWNVDLDELEIGCPSPPCEPTALACSDWMMLVLGNSWGVWVDLETGRSGEVSLPEGLDSFAELSGSKTVNSPADRAFIVGPSRTAEASNAVLVLEPDGTLTVLRTRAARRAAAALWVDGTGLVVVGGTDAAAALEAIGEEGDEFVELAFPSFPVYSSQVSFDAPRLVSLGGFLGDGSPAAGATFDLDCVEACEAVQLPLALGIAGGVATKSEDATYTVIGEDGEGFTVGSVVDTQASSVKAIPSLRKRRNAGYAILPTGHLGAIGGDTSQDAAKRRVELVLP